MSRLSGKNWWRTVSGLVFKTGRGAHRLGRASGAELKKKGRSVGSDRPLGWTGKDGGLAPERSVRRSGGGGLPAWTGSPERAGRGHGPVRAARAKSPQGPAGNTWAAFFRVRGEAPNAGGSVTRKKATMATKVLSPLLRQGFSVLPKMCCQI